LLDKVDNSKYSSILKIYIFNYFNQYNEKEYIIYYNNNYKNKSHIENCLLFLKTFKLIDNHN